MTARAPNRRIRLLFAVFGLLFLVALARAAWIQGVRGADYAKVASRQHLEPIEIPAGRGTVFDRTGAPLAIGQQATTVYADPRSIENPRRAAVAAASALDLDADELYEKLTDR